MVRGTTTADCTYCWCKGEATAEPPELLRLERLLSISVPILLLLLLLRRMMLVLLVLLVLLLLRLSVLETTKVVRVLLPTHVELVAKWYTVETLHVGL
jgi:hypothetical protein